MKIFYREDGTVAGAVVGTPEMEEAASFAGASGVVASEDVANIILNPDIPSHILDTTLEDGEVVLKDTPTDPPDPDNT